jgi:hypothetical protein
MAQQYYNKLFVYRVTLFRSSLLTIDMGGISQSQSEDSSLINGFTYSRKYNLFNLELKARSIL